MRAGQPRPDRHSLGRRGEAAAAELIQGLGLRIIARNLRTRTGEIDLLAEKRHLLVAIEVKTRSFDPAPEWTLTARQQARLSRTLSILATTHRPRPRVLRIDVVAVRCLDADRELEVRHFQGEEFPLAAP